tara:strand:+ start:135 stop:551 length:417 start_codon:yes stop_codon:yes gene_type:complete
MNTSTSTSTKCIDVSKKYVYVRGDYFGIDLSEKYNINITNTVFVGVILKTFSMSGNNWHSVFWFFLNDRMWIDSKHLCNLPENTNIINGLAYITKSNIKKFIINNNKYIHNILDKENNSEKENDNANEYKDQKCIETN